MQAIDTGRQEFRMGTGSRTGLLILGVVFGGFGAVIAFLAAAHSSAGVGILVCLIPLALGCYLIASALRSRLVIEGSRMEVRGAFNEKTADLSEIEGYRTIASRNGSYWQLRLKDGRSITVTKSFDCDGVRAWLAQIPDLDERDRKAVLDEIEQNQELGATPEERLARLAGAKRMNIGLSALAIVAALAFCFGGAQLHVPSAIVLAAIPAALIYLVHRDPLLYAIMKPKRDPRTDLSIAFIASGLGLLFGNHSVHFVETAVMLEYAGLIALVCCAGIYSAARRNPQFWGAMIGMLIFAGMYGWGLAAAADSVPDKSAPTSYTTTVVNKHESHGRSTSYYLDLAPWGPMQRPNDLSVSYSVYRDTAIGDPVCLELRPGALRVQWYQLVECSGSGQ
jgi:hypothetical protein